MSCLKRLGGEISDAWMDKASNICRFICIGHGETGSNDIVLEAASCFKTAISGFLVTVPPLT